MFGLASVLHSVITSGAEDSGLLVFWTPPASDDGQGKALRTLARQPAAPDLCTVLGELLSASVRNANGTVLQKVTRIGLPPPGIHAMPTPVSTLAFDTQQELLWTGNEYVSCIERTSASTPRWIYAKDSMY